MMQGLISIYRDSDLRTSVKNIKCPIHHRLRQGISPEDSFVKIPNDNAKHFTKDQMKRFGLKNWKYKRDRYGNRIINFKNFEQPEVSALYLREKVYTPNHPVCLKCRRCIQ